MPKLRKIGRVTFRELTNEEALREYGTSFIFVVRTSNVSSKPIDISALSTRQTTDRVRGLRKSVS